MTAQNIYYTFYTCLILFLLSTFWFAIQAFRGKPSWGQARVMGLTATMFIWIQIIFGLVVFESVFGIVSFIINLPLWVDILIALIAIIIIFTIYFKLSKKSTFKPKLFILLILVPLGVPGIHVVAKFTKLGALELSEKYGIYYVKTYDHSTIESSPKVKLHWPQVKNTIIGKIKFINSHQKGRLGDRLTAYRLTGMGYKKLKSKLNNIHGIDGVYIKKDKNGNMVELLIVENKVDKSSLNKKTKQMSDEWVLLNAEKLIHSDDIHTKVTGKLILDTYKNQRDIFIKQVWRHDLEQGVTISTIRGINAEKIDQGLKWQDEFIANELKRWCANGKLECIE